MISLKRYLEQRPDKLPARHHGRLSRDAGGDCRRCASLLSADRGGPATRALTGRRALEERPRRACFQVVSATGAQIASLLGRPERGLLHAKDGRGQGDSHRIGEYGRVDRQTRPAIHPAVQRDHVSLQSIAQLDDLSRIRVSLLRSAGELRGLRGTNGPGRNRVHRPVGSQSRFAIASQLEQAQELATLDPLTGLYNRREVEARIARKLTGQDPVLRGDRRPQQLQAH